MTLDSYKLLTYFDKWKRQILTLSTVLGGWGLCRIIQNNERGVKCQVGICQTRRCNIPGGTPQGALIQSHMSLNWSGDGLGGTNDSLKKSESKTTSDCPAIPLNCILQHTMSTKSRVQLLNPFRISILNLKIPDGRSFQGHKTTQISLWYSVLIQKNFAK